MGIPNGLGPTKHCPLSSNILFKGGQKHHLNHFSKHHQGIHMRVSDTSICNYEFILLNQAGKYSYKKHSRKSLMGQFKRCALVARSDKLNKVDAKSTIFNVV